MKVQCIERPGNYLTVGRIYNVEKQDQSSYTIKDNQGDELPWPRHFFRIFEMDKPMSYTSKYSLFQEVYVLDKFSNTFLIPCHNCNVDGQVLVNNKVYSCPSCKGRKYISFEEEAKWGVVNDKKLINEVKIRQNMYKKYAIFYEVSFTYHEVLEENIFLTIESAKLECDKRNAKK
jgi:hypothetical protein